MDKKIHIKGSADFSSVTREVKRLTGTIQESLGKNGASIFDDKSIKFLRSEAQNALIKMQAQMKKLVEEAKNLDTQLKSSVGTEEKHNDLLAKRYDNLRKISSMAKSIKDIQGEERRISRGGVDISQLKNVTGSGLSRILQNLPRVGGAAGVLVESGRAAGGMMRKGPEAGGGMGMGTMAMGASMAALTAVIGGTILAFNRISDSFDYFAQQVPGLLTKAAIGLGEGISARQRQFSTQMGFSPEETIQTQIDVARAFGTQRSARAQENLAVNTQMAGRALGIDPSQIAGTANQMRGAMGVRQSENATAQILSRAMTQGMDKSQATHFMSATAGLLSDINKSGLMSNDALIGAMASLTKNNMMSPEQAARTISGMQGAITGSTGETNAFFQRAFGRSGVGGGSLFGAQYGVRQGLMGVNPSEFLSQTGNKQGLSDLRSMGLVQDKDFMAKRAKGILSEVNAIGFNERSPEGRLQKSAFIGQQFGAQTLPEAMKIQSVLEKMAKGETLSAKEQKIMKTMGQDPEARWRDESLKALNTIAGRVAGSKAGEAFAKFELGRDSAGTMTRLIDANTALTQAINGLTNAITGGAENPSDSVTGKMLGGQNLMDQGMDKLASWMGFKSPTTAAAQESMGMMKMNPEEQKRMAETPIPTAAVVEAVNNLSLKVEEGNKDRKDLAKKPHVPAAVPKVIKSRMGG